MDSFSALSVERLGWYVYLLIDPRSNAVFYVGKGKGNRAFAHEAAAVDLSDHPELQAAKHARILAIRAAGHRVGVEVLRHGIESEKQAYVVESAAIDLAGRLQSEPLLNVVLGHHHAQHGLMTAEEIEVLYAAQTSPEPEVAIMLVSLNRLWTPTMTPEQLREATCGWWKAGGLHKRNPAYLMGVHNGVIRTIYKPTNWRLRQEGDRGWSQADVDQPSRWGCDGVDAPEMAHWLRTSVKRFMTSTQWSVRYIGPR